jgi:transposase-like protein
MKEQQITDRLRHERKRKRGVEGKALRLVATDGCPGLGAAVQTVYPLVAHQLGWVYKMRNIPEKVRRLHDAVKAAARAICRAGYRKRAIAAFRRLLGAAGNEITPP